MRLPIVLILVSAGCLADGTRCGFSVEWLDQEAIEREPFNVTLDDLRPYPALFAFFASLTSPRGGGDVVDCEEAARTVNGFVAAGADVRTIEDDPFFGIFVLRYEEEPYEVGFGVEVGH